MALSIRPHQIELTAAEDGDGAAARGINALRGTVRRASFLGEAVDYQIEIADCDLVLRVAAAPHWRCRPGEAVSLRIDPAACVRLE